MTHIYLLLFERMLFEKQAAQGGIFDEVKNGYHPAAIAEILGLLSMAKRQFEANVSTNLITDNLLLKILEVRYKWNINA